jgi:gamma-glutamyltranspeptidase
MSHAMISAAQPGAPDAGADILRAGGNVVDAAVAAALVQTAVDPQICGIAGMGCMHLYLPARGTQPDRLPWPLPRGHAPRHVERPHSPRG